MESGRDLLKGDGVGSEMPSLVILAMEFGLVGAISQGAVSSSLVMKFFSASEREANKLSSGGFGIVRVGGAGVFLL